MEDHSFFRRLQCKTDYTPRVSIIPQNLHLHIHMAVKSQCILFRAPEKAYGPKWTGENRLHILIQQLDWSTVIGSLAMLSMVVFFFLGMQQTWSSRHNKVWLFCLSLTCTNRSPQNAVGYFLHPVYFPNTLIFPLSHDFIRLYSEELRFSQRESCILRGY